jgi:hypothetical protein
MVDVGDEACLAALATALGHAPPFSDQELLTVSSLTITHARDVEPLAGCKNLEHLRLVACELENLHPLDEIESVTQLEIHATRLKSISGLTAGNLERIEILFSSFEDSGAFYGSQHEWRGTLIGNPLNELGRGSVEEMLQNGVAFVKLDAEEDWEECCQLWARLGACWGELAGYGLIVRPGIPTLTENTFDAIHVPPGVATRALADPEMTIAKLFAKHANSIVAPHLADLAAERAKLEDEACLAALATQLGHAAPFTADERASIKSLTIVHARDLAPLAGCVGLEHLRVIACELEHLGALVGMSKLAHLEIHCTRLGSLRGLEGTPSLTRIDLLFSSLEHPVELLSHASVRECNLVGNPLYDVRLWELKSKREKGRISGDLGSDDDWTECCQLWWRLGAVSGELAGYGLIVRPGIPRYTMNTYDAIHVAAGMATKELVDPALTLAKLFGKYTWREVEPDLSALPKAQANPGDPACVAALTAELGHGPPFSDRALGTIKSLTITHARDLRLISMCTSLQHLRLVACELEDLMALDPIETITHLQVHCCRLDTLLGITPGKLTRLEVLFSSLQDGAAALGTFELHGSVVGCPLNELDRSALSSSVERGNSFVELGSLADGEECRLAWSRLGACSGQFAGDYGVLVRPGIPTLTQNTYDAVHVPAGTVRSELADPGMTLEKLFAKHADRIEAPDLTDLAASRSVARAEQAKQWIADYAGEGDRGCLVGLATQLGHAPPFTLEELARVRSLTVMHARDLRPLAGCVRLEHLKIVAAELASLDEINELEHLAHLEVQCTRLGSLSGLMTDTLSRIDVMFCSIEDASGLIGATHGWRGTVVGNPWHEASYGALVAQLDGGHGLVDCGSRDDWEECRQLWERLGACSGAVTGSYGLLVRPGIPTLTKNTYDAIHVMTGTARSALRDADVTLERIFAAYAHRIEAPDLSQLSAQRVLGWSKDAKQWIAESRLGSDDKDALERFVSRFPRLAYYRATKAAIARTEKMLEHPLPYDYRVLRETLDGWNPLGRRMVTFDRFEEYSPRGDRIATYTYNLAYYGHGADEEAAMERAKIFCIGMSREFPLSALAITLEGTSQVFEYSPEDISDALSEGSDVRDSIYPVFSSYAAMLGHVTKIES